MITITSLPSFPTSPTPISISPTSFTSLGEVHLAVRDLGLPNVPYICVTILTEKCLVTGCGDCLGTAIRELGRVLESMGMGEDSTFCIK